MLNQLKLVAHNLRRAFLEENITPFASIWLEFKNTNELYNAWCQLAKEIEPYMLGTFGLPEAKYTMFGVHFDIELCGMKIVLFTREIPATKPVKALGIADWCSNKNKVSAL